ncbi:hypothetical protein [Rahnella selenatireducens]|uniref:hypothetical protein n=1 Tax=Rahnella selenatireducens TaxID=3389797 RepID=UPI00396820BE
MIFTIAACDSKNMQEVQPKIKTFQAEYNDNSLKEMYAETSNDFKNAMPEGSFIILMMEKKKMLGTYEKSRVLYSLEKDNSLIKITYVSDYEKYILAEEFVYKKNKINNKFELFSFLVDSGGFIQPVMKK